MALVILHNRIWHRGVRVQIRQGNNANAELNPLVWDGRIPDGGSQSIQSDGEDIYFRRERDPDHTFTGWQIWTHRPVYDDPKYDEDIV